MGSLVAPEVKKALFINYRTPVMYTFFSIVFGIIWAIASFVLLFKVWDKIGPVVLSMSKSHVVQVAAMIIVYAVIFGIPAKICCWLFG